MARTNNAITYRYRFFKTLNVNIFFYLPYFKKKMTLGGNIRETYFISVKFLCVYHIAARNDLTLISDTNHRIKYPTCV